MFVGTWTQKGSKLTLNTDLTKLESDFYDALEQQLGDLGSVPLKPVFHNNLTGIISRDGKTIKGTYKLVVTFQFLEEGTEEGIDIPGTSLTISGGYVATYSETPTLAVSHAPTVSAQPRMTTREMAKGLAQIVKQNLIGYLTR